MKKNFVLFALSLVLLLGAVGCSNSGSKPEENSVAPATSEESVDSKKTVTVTTSFLEDMVHQLAKDMVNVELIIPAGEDPHLYVAQPSDLSKIEKADLLLYHGLHFEGKMLEALEPTGVIVSKNFPEDKIGTMEEDGEDIIDPHFWFDISLYKMAVEVASEELINLLPEQKDAITTNTENYLKELDALDAENKEKISQIPKENRYLITPHDAFNYFSRSYDIEVVAPQGVSTESEVSNQNIANTVDFIVEHKVKAIFAESTTDPARMEKLKESCKVKGWDVKVVSGEGQELFSDSLAPKGEEGDTYVSMYRHDVSLIFENLK